MYLRNVDEAARWGCRPEIAQILPHVLNLGSSPGFLSRLRFELKKNSGVVETESLTR